MSVWQEPQHLSNIEFEDAVACSEGVSALLKEAVKQMADGASRYVEQRV